MLWYETKTKSPYLSTRVRLARNLDGVPFLSKLTQSKITEICNTISETIQQCNFGAIKLRKIDMSTLGDTETYAMVERHCISPKFAGNREGRILLLSDDESVSIMIGEEDHLRIQVLLPGESLNKAYEICSMIDSELSLKLKFAFSEKIGYLTECPTNVGTGMRASVMMHLPILETTGELRNINEAVTKGGLVFRGFYGEGSQSKSAVYQLSNQITLGITEQATLTTLANVAKQLVERENEALSHVDKISLTDTVYRSFGILKYSYKMSTEEMITHLSRLMLGESANIISLPESINPLFEFINLQSSMIKRIKGEVSAIERDKIRAEFLREYFKNVEV